MSRSRNTLLATVKTMQAKAKEAEDLGVLLKARAERLNTLVSVMSETQCEDLLKALEKAGLMEGYTGVVNTKGGST